MAVLTEPTNTTNPFADKIGQDLAPVGTYVATVIDIKDEFGVVRQKFQSLETEKVDLTTFLFGLRDAQGNPHRIASRRMKISGNEKSTLFGFLKALLGKAPSFGWDYCSLKGAQCLLTVEHVRRKDGNGVFAGIAAMSPVPVGMGVPAQMPMAVAHPLAAPAPAPAIQMPVMPAPVVAAPPSWPQPASQPAPTRLAVEAAEDDVPF